MEDRANELDRHLRAISATTDPERASEIATAALTLGLRHSEFHAARARWLQSKSCDAEALYEFQCAVALAPRDPDLLNETGLALLRVDRTAKAIAAFEAAIRIAPARAQTHYYKGCAHSLAGDPDAALRSHERAIALQPGHADALAAVAAAAARAGETAKARPIAERALRVAPAHPTAAIALAMCDLQDGEFVRASGRLDALLSKLPIRDQTRALALGFLGDALDGQNRADAAFECYAAKNEILRDLNTERFKGESRMLTRVEGLIAGLSELTAPPRAGAAAPSPAKQHVFLLGFMRSGTTLLEQVFAAHSDVETLEERETFAPLSAAYLYGADGLQSLSCLSGSDLDRAHAIYWQRVRKFGARPDGKIFLEKQPFNTLNLPLIATLFPSAKIIFLVRDPRDVLLSCFRRHLEIKPATFELLTLDGAARFYDRVMQFAEICRSKLPLDVFECRYEDIVLDFDDRVLAICRFIGVQWMESLREFQKSARSRTIRSVSSNQVRQPLYANGVGCWRRYETQLSPVLPLLQPWVDRFGYPAN